MLKTLSCLVLIVLLAGCGTLTMDVHADWEYPAVEPTALDNALEEIENGNQQRP